MSTHWSKKHTFWWCQNILLSAHSSQNCRSTQSDDVKIFCWLHLVFRIPVPAKWQKLLFPVHRNGNFCNLFLPITTFSFTPTTILYTPSTSLFTPHTLIIITQEIPTTILHTPSTFLFTPNTLIIIIIQEISTAHNPKLKARAKCAQPS